MRLANLGLIDQQSLVEVNFYYNIFSIEYPSTITFDISQDLVCSSTTIDIDADNVNAYENL
jgi:hypothetical protein